MCGKDGHWMNEKLLPLLGIARKAGRLSLGADPAQEAMSKGKTSLLFLASDLSERSRRNIMEKAEQYGVTVITLDASKDALGAGVGKMTGIIAVNDKGFAEKMKTLCAE